MAIIGVMVTTRLATNAAGGQIVTQRYTVPTTVTGPVIRFYGATRHHQPLSVRSPIPLSVHCC